MPLSRRRLLQSLAAAAAAAGAVPRQAAALPVPPSEPPSEPPLRLPNGAVDWRAVRALFPLAPDWVHLASFLLVSHPRPVAQDIERWRRKIDADAYWIEKAWFDESEGKPFARVKQALAEYVGGAPDEICLTSNTTGALAMAWHGLRIRPDQEVLTTTHDHYVHHESIRYAAERSGCSVRRIALYDAPAAATADEMAERLAREIRPTTRAIGVTWVHSSTGVKIPVQRMAEAVARANAGRADADRCLLVVDGVHGFGNQDVDVARLGADFFATGTHKWLLAPRGTGFLWGRRDAWPALRPTIPAFDADGLATWGSWMEGTPLPPTTAAFVSPGGFLAYEHQLAIPAAVALHQSLGRAAIAARIQALNAAFREGAARLPNVTLHTPRDPSVSGGLSAFEVAGVAPADVSKRLAARKIRVNESPYKVSYARVAAGLMNSPEDIETVLRALRGLTA